MLVAPAIALLPPGRLFAGAAKLLRWLIDGLMREFSRLMYRARQLLAQSCPGRDGEMAQDWARVTGVATPAEVAERWGERHVLTRANILALFPDAYLGAPIAKEWRPRMPFRAGASMAGHATRSADARFAVDLVLTCSAFDSESARKAFMAARADSLAAVERRWPPYAVLAIWLTAGGGGNRWRPRQIGVRE